MSVLRTILFENLGLKFVALLLALGVYFNAYTDRPATWMVSFPIQVVDLADSLALLGPLPPPVTVELRGTGKQLIRLRVTEPPIKISLAGVSPGHFERALGPEDLPLPQGVEVDRFVSARTLDLEIDRKTRRRVPVAARVEGEPAHGIVWPGWTQASPAVVEVIGPAQAVAEIDSVRLTPVGIAGRRDTVRSSIPLQAPAAGVELEPARIDVTVPLEPGLMRRVALEIEPPRNAGGYAVRPARATAIVSGPRRTLASDELDGIRLTWTMPSSPASHVGSRIALRRLGRVPPGVRVRLEPDSVTLIRARS
jgi:YbbR domain-containing protein